MLFKRGKVERPELPKEYVWELEVMGEDHTYSCVVTETMVTTYEDGVEKKHLKVTNPECDYGVLQIDTVTALFGDLVPFQLERFIPYIKLDGEWVSSDTTKKDRLDATVAKYRSNAKWELIIGVLCVVVSLAASLIQRAMGDWYILNVFGFFFIFGGISTRVRLKQELQAMEKNQEEVSEKAKEETQDTEEKGIPQGLGAPREEQE